MKYLVIDGNFFMYRAINKMGELKRSDGVDTGMEYGFIRMLKSTVDEIKPNKTLVVFDGGLSELRLDKLPEYKSNRKVSSEGTEKSRGMLINIIESLGIPVFKYNGVEADDIIGILSGLLEDNEKLIIASSDTDFIQLMSNNVKIYNPIRKQYLESPVEPKDYVLYKSIIGDISDNIRGIKGIGPIKAKSKLLSDDWKESDKEIIERNKILIHITKDMNDFDTYYYLINGDVFRLNFMSWVNDQKKMDMDKFLYLCKFMEFYSILSNLTSWRNTFGDKLNLDIW